MNLLVLIPRFVTREMAMWRIGRSSLYDVARELRHVGPREKYDGIATVTSFNLFGLTLMERQVGNVRPWINPHDKVTQ
jgi:hypothetical protein